MTPLDMAVKLARKFVKKVETGKAFSKETYKDCKEFLEAYNEFDEEDIPELCGHCDRELETVDPHLYCPHCGKY
jgi:hypothetical protein